MSCRTDRLILQIRQGDLVNAALETVGGDPGALGPVDESLADIADLEDGRGLDVVPVLAGEGVDDLLLHTLLASLGEALKVIGKIEVRKNAVSSTFGRTSWVLRAVFEKDAHTHLLVP
jgi:hypothetical protein